TGCAPIAVTPSAAPPATVAPAAAQRPLFRAEKLAAIDAAIAAAIAAKKTPGGVFWLERDAATGSGQAAEIYRKTYGQRARVPAPEPLTDDTIFDAASLT